MNQEHALAACRTRRLRGQLLCRSDCLRIVRNLSRFQAASAEALVSGAMLLRELAEHRVRSGAMGHYTC